jgi:hypothetical protein
MDLVAFTDFVLAWDHRSHPAAIKYFFPIMDLQGKVGRDSNWGSDGGGFLGFRILGFLQTLKHQKQLLSVGPHTSDLYMGGVWEVTRGVSRTCRLANL